MDLILQRVSADGEVSRLPLSPGLQRVTVAVGDRFGLADAKGATPPGIVVRRLDNDLIVDGVPGGAAVELSEFYARCGVSSPCSLDLAFEGAAPVSITPGAEPLRALTDGSFVLYPPGFDPVADTAAAPRDGGGFAGGAVGGWMVGGVVLGALAIAGLAGGGASGADPGGAIAGGPPSAAPDLTPPASPKVLSPATAPSGLVSVAGEAEAGARVTVAFDTGRDGSPALVFSTLADAGGRWAVDLARDLPTTGVVPAGGLPDGAVIVSVVAIDAASNVSETTVFTLLVDASAPGAPRIVSIRDDVPGRIGLVADGGTTNDLTPTISGTLARALADGERLEVLRNGEVVATLDPGEGTAWSFTDSGLVYGRSYDYDAVTVDAFGNRSEPSDTWRIVTDRATSKTASITGAVDDVPQKTGTLASNAITNDATPTLVGRLSAALDADETLQVYRDGALTTLVPNVAGTAFSVTDARLADGAHAYTVRVVDAEGAGAMSAAFRVTVDTVNTKTATITAITDNAQPGIGVIPPKGSTNDRTPTLSGKVSSPLASGEAIEILRDDVVVKTLTVNGSNWSWTDGRLETGERYTYSVRIVDAAGNAGSESAGYEIRVLGNGVGTTAVDEPLHVDALFDAGIGSTADAAPSAVAGIAALALAPPGGLDTLLERPDA